MAPAHFIREPLRNSCCCLGVKFGIAHHTTLAYITPSNLKLWLNQRQESGTGSRKLKRCW